MGIIECPGYCFLLIYYTKQSNMKILPDIEKCTYDGNDDGPIESGWPKGLGKYVCGWAHSTTSIMIRFFLPAEMRLVVDFQQKVINTPIQF